MIAKTIGTHISFAFETVAGKRPTSGYRKWCQCTSHPDFNPEPDQIETTTLCEETMHTYEDGLYDYGTLEYGSNLDETVYDLIIDTILPEYIEKEAQGLRLWICNDIKNFAHSFYVPVKPLRNGFGMPEGESGSNKYDLVVRFMPVAANTSNADSAGWYDDPIYEDETTYTATITGYDIEGVTINIMSGNRVVSTFTTSSTSTDVVLASGTYIVIARYGSQSPQVQELDLTSGNETITFTAFTTE